MITLRQIERLFDDHQHRRLYRELIAGRPEATLPLENELGRTVPVAALGILRLDELSQSHAPLFRRLLNVVLTGQQADGGWTDPMTTAVCVRALLPTSPQGVAAAATGGAIDRGIAHLANLQKDDGLWPREPLRRMPADAFASAFILLQLGDRERFRRSVRFADAAEWFVRNERTCDADTQRLWSRAAPRCRAALERDPAQSPLWTATRPAA